MKVRVGKYINFIGPYQLAEYLLYPFHLVNQKTKYTKPYDIPIPFPFVHKFGKWLSNTWVEGFLEKIHEKRKRTVNVKIHDYDVWSLDHTLALIILPALKEFQKNITGACFVADEDVPEELRSTNAGPKENEWDTDDLWHKRYEWIVGEMVWAFEQIVDEDAENQFYEGGLMKEKWEAWEARKRNGLRLFGEYFQGLWN